MTERSNAELAKLAEKTLSIFLSACSAGSALIVFEGV